MSATRPVKGIGTGAASVLKAIEADKMAMSVALSILANCYVDVCTMRVGLKGVMSESAQRLSGRGR